MMTKTSQAPWVNLVIVTMISTHDGHAARRSALIDEAAR